MIYPIFILTNPIIYTGRQQTAVLGIPYGKYSISRRNCQTLFNRRTGRYPYNIYKAIL